MKYLRSFAQSLPARVRRLPMLMAVLLLAAVSFAPLAYYQQRVAAEAAPGGAVSFTFDDGTKDTFFQSAPALADYGMTGTAYITTNYIGKSDYMTWQQVKKLAQDYKWEIGSHSVTHPLSTEISNAKKNQEAKQSAEILRNKGFNPTAYATPYGDYDNGVLASIARYYESHRGFWDIGQNSYPGNNLLIQVRQVQAGVSVEDVKSYMQEANSNGQWLVLVFHRVREKPSTDPGDYEYATADLRRIAAYAKQTGLAVRTVSEMTGNRGQNLLANSSFANGLAGGWQSDSNGIAADTGNNGNYPEAVHSIGFSAGQEDRHLFAPRLNVQAGSTYYISSFLNLQRITSGSVGFYLDEYDTAGNWVSGQYKASRGAATVSKIAFEYSPSSSQVRQMRLHFIVEAGSNAKGFVDSFHAGLVKSAPEPANLMTNSSFDAGLAGGWRTDAAAFITADNSNHGSPAFPQHAIRITSDPEHNTHLFSPTVTVTNQTYRLEAYLDISSATQGGVGFYMDEYDAAGNWVSGQYLTDYPVASTHAVVISYAPSSEMVALASLQTIAFSGNGLLAYLDDVSMYAQ